MANEKKSFSITIEKSAESPKVFDYFLIKSSEDALEIDLAEKKESSNKIELRVTQSFSISSDRMIQFCVDVISALEKYEEKYKNGKGLPAFPTESGQTE